MLTAVWLSAAVLKIWLLRVGIVVFRLDELREDPAERLDAQRQWCNVEQQDVLHVATENATLDRSADHGYHFVRVHASVRLTTEELLHEPLHRRDSRRAANEDDFVDIGGGEPASLIACWHGPFVFSTRSPTICSNLRPCQAVLQVLGPLESAVMKGRLMSVCCVLESSFFAFSAASLRRCSAMRSWARSIP